MNNENIEIIPSGNRGLQVSEEEVNYIKKALNDVRDEFSDNPYIQEARRVLTVQGYRSAIGSYWNAVVDDLRNKVLHRSIDLFNKEMHASLKREIKTYEDFQNHVTDYDLIEGAYKIGVIDWEARKVLHHARETRNIFDGHPRSSEPSVIKVIDLIIDCNKYVLSQEYPHSIINIEDYITAMDTNDYMRDELAVEQTIGDLPDVYKIEMINRFFDIYKHEATSTTLRSNIEFSSPILWRFLPRDTKHQIGKRVDRELQSGQGRNFEQSARFLMLVDGSLRYTVSSTRQVLYNRDIEALEKSLDSWDTEGTICARLEKLGMSIPDDLLDRYVQALTHTYVGYQGQRAYYSWTAAPIIRRMFEKFDEEAATSFVKCVKESSLLRSRLGNRSQLERLRNLADILIEKTRPNSDTRRYLELLADETKDKEFYKSLNK
jgi:hypothetical protein